MSTPEGAEPAIPGHPQRTIDNEIETDAPQTDQSQRGALPDEISQTKGL